jgi:nicotinamide phosphoribosyltransferase
LIKQKKSLVGRVKVYKENNEFIVKDKCNANEEKEGLLETVYKDGVFDKIINFKNIRKRIDINSQNI